MKKELNLIKAIKEAAKDEEKELDIISRAIVLSVDETNYTIKAVKTEDEGESEKPVYEVSLRASVLTGDLGIILIPEVQSIVAIGFSNNSENQAIMLSCSKIAKLIITAGIEIETKIDGSVNGKLKITTDGISIGEALEPVVLGNTLKTWCQDVDTAINAIITWAATGIAPSGGASDVGGIAPLSGVTAPSFPAGALSEKHKVD